MTKPSVETIPVCEFCGTPYQPTHLDPAIYQLRTIGDRLRYAPACDCLMKERRKDFLKARQLQIEQACRAEIERRFLASRLSRRFRERTFENFIPRDTASERSLSLIYEYAHQFEQIRNQELNGLYIYGSWDLGKTHLAAAVVNHLVPREVSVIYLKITRLASELREAFSSGSSVESIKQPIFACDLLVLDDLGVGNHREWFNTDLFDILDFRYESRQPVIITSNLDLEQIAQYYDRRIAIRIQRMCQMVKV